MTRTDISAALNPWFDYNPLNQFKDTGLIHQWVADGCDLTKDIVPTMAELMKCRKDIGNLSYFTKAVHQARLNRLDVEKAHASRPAPASEREKAEAKARSIAFLIRKLGRCMPCEERWLAEWEEKNGTVAL